MPARLFVGIVGLVFVLLAATTASLAQSPTPVPTLPGCSPDVQPSPQGPEAPSDMHIEDLEMVDGYWRYSLRWQDNSTDETCFGLQKRLNDGPWQWAGPIPADVTVYVIDVSFAGRLCERVYAGNQAGRSDYSNEACVELPQPPSSPTPTPVVTPVGCGFFASPTPVTGHPPNPSAPGAPAPPTDLRAELVFSPELVSGSAVRLTWQDNADNETCYGVAMRL